MEDRKALHPKATTALVNLNLVYPVQSICLLAHGVESQARCELCGKENGLLAKDTTSTGVASARCGVQPCSRKGSSHHLVEQDQSE